MSQECERKKVRCLHSFQINRIHSSSDWPYPPVSKSDQPFAPGQRDHRPDSTGRTVSALEWRVSVPSMAPIASVAVNSSTTAYSAGSWATRPGSCGDAAWPSLNWSM